MKSIDKKELNSITQELRQLKKIEASGMFHTHVSQVLLPSLPERKIHAYPLFTYALAILLIFVLSGSGIVYASTFSKPGQALYVVKQSVNAAASILFRPDPGTQTLEHIQKADTSLRQIQKSSLEHNAKGIESGVHEYSSQVSQTVEDLQDSSIRESRISQSVSDSLNKQEQELKKLKEAAPSPAQSVIQQAIDASQKANEDIQTNQGNLHTDNAKSGDSTNIQQTNGVRALQNTDQGNQSKIHIDTKGGD